MSEKIAISFYKVCILNCFLMTVYKNMQLWKITTLNITLIFTKRKAFNKTNSRDILMDKILRTCACLWAHIY